MTKLPTCEATLRDGSRCKSVVASKGERYCSHHAAKQAEAAIVEDIAFVEDVPPVDDAAIDEVVAATPGTTPRQAIREAGLRSVDLVGGFFESLLSAKRRVWVTCRHCSRRSEVEVPDWSARVRGLETLLSEGWGRPEAAPLDADEKLAATVRDAISELSEERLLQLVNLDDLTRHFVERPLIEQQLLDEVDADDIASLARKHGYTQLAESHGYPLSPA